MATNQNDYHYWEGSFKGLLPNEILELSDEDFQTLYEEFIEAKIHIIYLKGYIEGRILKQFFKNFLYDINPDYLNYFNTVKEIDLFRSLSVNRIEEISFDDKGICWTYDSSNIRYIEQTLVPDNKYLTRFYGTTPIDNIDWIESFFLYINYNAKEKELRVYDSQKVFLKGYINIDYSTMIEYSKDGETSYLLEGTVTKEDFLKERESLLKKFLYIPQTNRYDYDGDLNKNDLSILVSEDKDGFIINFGKVTGDFNCSDLGLKSLKGAPQEVGKSFWCFRNKLTSLKGAPKEVGWNFNCSDNQLTSLEGAPQTVGRDFYCSDNQLTSLEGAPKKVGGGFYCYNNQLISLKGAPREVGGIVGGSFSCSNNKLISLEGAPQKVGGDFYCRNNPDLNSLDGIGEVRGKIYKDF